MKSRQFLAPLGTLYGIGMRVRNKLYDAAISKQHRLAVPVICVGNLTVGGTGKTPVVALVARMLIDGCSKPGIISRGYRRATSPDELVLVSNGERVLATPEQAGDEAAMLPRKLPGVPVAVCADRVRAGNLLVSDHRCDCIVMDDGFQHRRLARDIDLVLIDATQSLAEMRIFPAGPLREPLSAARRATAFVHTKVTDANRPTQHANMELLKKHSPTAPHFTAQFQLGDFCAVTGGEAAPVAKGTAIGAFAGTAHPEQFFDSLRRKMLNVQWSHTLEDHVTYTPELLSRMTDEAASAGCDVMVTTEKDAVKLRAIPPPRVPLLYAQLLVDLQPRADFCALLASVTRPAAGARQNV